MKFSILIPTYNGEKTIVQTLQSILFQSFVDYEIIICDDASTDNTVEVIKSFPDPRINFFGFQKNLGYAKNLQRCFAKANSEIIFLMAQDDILASGALQKTCDAFFLADDIGAVTRPYFWFDKDIKKPVRAVLPFDNNKNAILLAENPEHFLAVVKSIGQLSGLAFRRKFLNIQFNENCFVAHVYPFLGIFKNHKGIFLNDYTVAVRISSSQTRFNQKIYNPSPLKTWIEMFKNVLPEDEFKKSREIGIKHMTTHFVGLVQIKNYAPVKFLWREIWLHLKFRPQNIFNLKLWFYSLLCLLLPRQILRPLTDWYKEKINVHILPDISFSSPGSH